MATDTTDNLGLTTVEAGDRLPETVSKDNFEILDQYVAATAMTNKSGSQRSAGDVVIADTLRQVHGESHRGYVTR
jgi:hypothetical protein